MLGKAVSYQWSYFLLLHLVINDLSLLSFLIPELLPDMRVSHHNIESLCQAESRIHDYDCSHLHHCRVSDLLVLSLYEVALLGHLRESHQHLLSGYPHIIHPQIPIVLRVVPVLWANVANLNPW